MSTEDKTPKKAKAQTMNIKQFVGAISTVSGQKKNTLMFAFRNAEDRTASEWEKTIQKKYPKLNFKAK